MYRPAIYKITSYKPFDDQSELDLEQIPIQVVSNIGLYRNVARCGNEIKVAGKLERVESTSSSVLPSGCGNSNFRGRIHLASNIALRDRDAIETSEGLIFRVFGYSHPPGTYICDAEYASSKIFQSTDPRAPRTGKPDLYYKFYNDEGMKLVNKQYKQYLVFHQMLDLNLVGVKSEDIAEARKPEQRLQQLLKAGPTDELLAAMERVLKISLDNSGLKDENFGVFGSMLHGFHHPKFSDIDFIIYGKEENCQNPQNTPSSVCRQGFGFE